MSVRDMVDIRCPRGCAGVLCRDFEGDFVTFKCRCGWYFVLSRVDPIDRLKPELAQQARENTVLAR